MTEQQITHEFRLYRSGWSDSPNIPWSDNQLWARSHPTILVDGDNSIILEPDYGSAAAYYRLYLYPAESAETDWAAWLVELVIDTATMGRLPLSWYVGAPADWPSGLARYPERHGPTSPTGKGHGSFNSGPRGVWTLAARRHS